MTKLEGATQWTAWRLGYQPQRSMGEVDLINRTVVRELTALIPGASVTVTATAIAPDPAAPDHTDDQLVEMTKRYLAPDKVDAYLEFARREHGESVAIWLKPEHWLSADLGSI